MKYKLGIKQLELLISIWHWVPDDNSTKSVVDTYLYGRTGDWIYGYEDKLEFIKPMYYSDKQRTIFNVLRNEFIKDNENI